jgi:hypothetical protein
LYKAGREVVVEPSPPQPSIPPWRPFTALFAAVEAEIGAHRAPWPSRAVEAALPQLPDTLGEPEPKLLERFGPLFDRLCAEGREAVATELLEELVPRGAAPEWDWALAASRVWNGRSDRFEPLIAAQPHWRSTWLVVARWAGSAAQRAGAWSRVRWAKVDSPWAAARVSGWLPATEAASLAEEAREWSAAARERSRPRPASR